ncbi:NfeD family protein [Nocardioides panacisoli]|uniref:NfeD family protein n=1 Tax=Nocardioides panacisoli TaxID=627624 RepID=UPI001C62486C|nr:NfeD family protein [Nocardioides panacisoli]QYJ05011.1 NfeD family protein [Nocardioides panacisoli]
MDWLRDHLWEAWLAGAFALTIAELFSMELILIMLASGAVAGMVLAVAGAPFLVQALAAAAVSVGMIAFVRRPIAQRLHGGPDLEIGAERLVGERAVVTSEISGLVSGQIRLDGETWSAAAEGDTVLKPGEPVEVVAIDGATARVKPATSGELSDPTSD